jgi:glycogen operon protein
MEWHGVRLNQPDWSHHSHSIALTGWSLRGRFVAHVMINAYREPLVFELPLVPEPFDHGWRRWIDTSLPSPDDICLRGEAPLIDEHTYLVQEHSVVVLLAGTPMAALGERPV